MLFALGAVSSALDALQSLATSATSPAHKTGFNQGAANPFSIDATTTSSVVPASVNSANGPQISPQTMSALIAAQGQSSPAGSTGLAAMSPQAALKDLFSLIDADGGGKITKSEFENALGAGGTNLAQADDVFSKLDANGDASVSLDELSRALKGGRHHGHHHVAGSGQPGAPGSATSSYNCIEQLIQREAQGASSSPASSLSVRV